MAKTEMDVLLANIVREVKKDPSIKAVSDLSKELQENIRDSIPAIIAHLGLEKIHAYLLAFIPKKYQEPFKLPSQK